MALALREQYMTYLIDKQDKSFAATSVCTLHDSAA